MNLCETIQPTTRPTISRRWSRSGSSISSASLGGAFSKRAAKCERAERTGGRASPGMFSCKRPAERNRLQQPLAVHVDVLDHRKVVPVGPGLAGSADVVGIAHIPVRADDPVEQIGRAS